MLRGSFGHRRFSITHRAVQRLRELVPTMEDLDDEALRDQLDRSLAAADADGKALRTIDAMLGEPQILVPLSEFGETLYAIVKEDTVVTVLPQGHGEEILQRGRALQERNTAPAPAAPDARPAAPAEEPRREVRRTPWRRDPLSGDPVKGEPAVTVLHRGGRPGPAQSQVSGSFTSQPSGTTQGPATLAASSESLGQAAGNVNTAGARRRLMPRNPADVHRRNDDASTVRRPTDKVGQALYDALSEGRRLATISALREVVQSQRGLDKAILPACESIFEAGLPLDVTLRELVVACRDLV
jgi:hypothetical protein